MPSSDCSIVVRGTQGWISTTKSSIFATKTIASVGSVTSDLQLGHKTYHCVDFQLLYTTSLESSSSNHSRAGQSFDKFFHAPHVPSVLLWSHRYHRHQNCLSLIYIVGKESTSSDGLCAAWIFNNIIYVPCTLHAPPYCLLASSVSSLCHVSLSCVIRHVITQSSTYIILLTSLPLTRWPMPMTLTLIVDFSELTFCNLGAPYLVFRIYSIFAIYFLHILLLNEE